MVRVRIEQAARLSALCTLLACWLGCDPVELHFTEQRVGGFQHADQVPEAGATTTLCQEPVSTGVSGPAKTLEIGDTCTRFDAVCATGYDKCTLVDLEGGALGPACVVHEGSRLEGECCERFAHGQDNCDIGAWCSPVGIGSVERGPMACRRMCSARADCGSGERCLAPGKGDFGICVPECRVLQDGCLVDTARCTAGRGPDDSYFGYCARFGAGQEGADCSSDADCDAALLCELREAETNGVCRWLCDQAHPCPTDRRCVPLGLGDPNSPRYCSL